VVGRRTLRGRVGRWSRLVAAEFVPWLGVPPGSTWVDVGCGTGELTRAILRTSAPSRVVSLDPSESYLEHARASTDDARVQFVRGSDQDVQSLAPRGVMAAYVWDYAEGMTMLRHFWDAAVAEDPAAEEKDEPVRFPICAPGGLQSVFEAAGVKDVTALPIEVTGRYADFDEYWTPFLSGSAPAPGYRASLPPERQARVREILRDRVPTATDGSITLTCRAWAARGLRS
jgi:SAM-dependent methyltransferase